MVKTFEEVHSAIATGSQQKIKFTEAIQSGTKAGTVIDTGTGFIEVAVDGKTHYIQLY